MLTVTQSNELRLYNRNQNNRYKMKTILITLLFGSSIIFTSLTASATGTKTTLLDEMYVNDIPFNTEAVFRSYMKDPLSLTIFSLKEEPYVNDIPFNTEDIALHANKTELVEEAYVDDIPFNTAEIAKNSK